VAVVGVVVAVAAGVLFLGRADSEGRLSSVEVETWEHRIEGPATTGGFVIQQGMKPAVAALVRGEGAVVAMQAVGWTQQLRTVRQKFAASAPPVGLEAAARSFDEALALYIDAAERIGAVGVAMEQPVRDKLLSDAIAVARRADARYDEASAALQRARRARGLEPTTRFPDPSS
jgi:hypothetical protein